MLPAHAATLTEARSSVAALADHARTFEASVEYEHVLLQLDWIHGDDNTPALDTRGLSHEPTVLYAVAESAIGELLGHGVDALRVELVLDRLDAARAKDVP